MDEKDLELYHEEQREYLIELNKSVKTLNNLIQTQIEKYVAPKDNIEVTGKVEVNTEKEVVITNLESVSGWLIQLGDTITKSLLETSYKPLEAVKISNLPEMPKAFEVKNLSDLKQFFVSLENAIKENQPIVNVAKQEIVLPTSANKPISVRLSDGKNFYNAIAGAIISNGLSALAKANLEKLTFNANNELEVDANFSGTIDIGDVQIKNAAGTVIDPATETKQDSQITQLANILIELTQKTEATQNQQVELINAIRLVLQSIANPAYVDKSANQMRSQVTGSLTAVTTVTNLTNIGSFPADHLQRMDNMTAWATNVRQIIV